MTFTDPIIVTYPVTESDAERKARQLRGEPTPVYSFTVSRYVEEDGDEKVG